jgi:hypothetical protein
MLIGESVAESPENGTLKYTRALDIESESTNLEASSGSRRLQEILEDRKDLKTFKGSSENVMRFQKDCRRQLKIQ